MNTPIRFNAGLKLRSNNTDLIPRALELYKQNVFQFIELYALPGTFEQTILKWEGLACPFTIHCPHSAQGFNLAQSSLHPRNLEIFEEVRCFADRLRVNTIVVHGGNNGPVEEACSQLKALADSRIFLENKPKVGMNGELCLGFHPTELQRLVDHAHLAGMVLDFGHAIYAANALGKDPFEHIQDFLSLRPKFFHLGDGEINAERDIHYSLGKGSFDLPRIISCIPEKSFVTIETPMDPKENLKDFEKDIEHLRAAVRR